MLKKYKLQISWSRFYTNFKADLYLWGYFVVFQQICRLYFIYTLSHYLAPETKFISILHAIAHGLRFDSLWATCWLFIPLICLTIPSLFVDISNKIKPQRFRQYLGGIFTFITMTMYIISIEYFREYKDIFNQFLFGWFYDDKIAILKTIYAEHHVIPNCVLSIAIMLIYFYYSRHLIHNARHISTPPKYSTAHKVILSIAIVFFYVISFRGGIGQRPVQLKDSAVTPDAFLNKAIVSPYSALKYAIQEHKIINNAYNADTTLYTHQAQAVAKKFFNTNQEYSTLAKYMEKTAKGSTFPRPKHIFLIVGESLDAWPLENKYRKFNLTPNLHKIITNSIYFKYFLPCSYTTMTTLNTLISGIPDSGLHLNYQKRSYLPYPTSLATQFKKLGFKTQFFYGGFLSWQRLGDFAHAQGFTSTYGAGHISNLKQTNEWGGDDGALFEFIIATIKAAKTPTFNVIMTTSNHPPFSIQVEKEGFDKEKITKLLTEYPNTDTNAKELGHIWYSDKTIGKFIEQMASIDKTALFVITGDHFGRKHILPNPPSFDKTAVPLIIYGAKINEYCALHNCNITNSTAGGHLDLGATLIELVAPKGFIYYSMGDNLLAARKFNFGIGLDKIITPDFIASVRTTDIMYFNKKEYLATKKNLTIPPQLNLFKERLNQATDIARYMIKNGEMLYDITKTNK